jgi:hypothetical protein
MQHWLKPVERSIVAALIIHPHQTIEQLQGVTKISTRKYLNARLRTLTLAGVLGQNTETQTYSVAPESAHV